ncbi:hypothetical protein G7Z17_g2700 [Cylindrodendrum hubeiense]|uniref:Major facilitator superfamily (MFS) profile domain-containing protein n=1 Tax=Cylindrodendrum hubeiense TaxID=595255 RepID=A0A9P5LIW3_9HYPO|nr:hypothetical protein G7Z17_g2700 [Cylindrodendrum hubeiense]
MEETSPLLVEAGEGRCESLYGDSHETVDFNPNGDVDNPLEWPAAFKWGIVAMLAFIGFTGTFNCISVVPVAGHIIDDLDGGHSTKSAAVLAVTIWELGEAAGPLLIAPLSEIFGRYPVIVVSNMLFMTIIVLTALSQSAAMFITLRALSGIAVTAHVLNPAIVGDIFAPDQRGSAMSFTMFASVIGGTLGPAIGGMVGEGLGWRAVIWTGVSMAVICLLIFSTCFRETYKVTILRKRAARLQKKSGIRSITSASGKEKGAEKGFAGLRTAIVRPAVVLSGSGVLVALSLFGAVIYSYLYVVSVTLPNILEDIYGFSPAVTGWAFLANGVGSLTSIFICNFSLDRIYIKLRAANNGIGLPEHRLPLAIIGAFMIPPALALYGWCAEYKLPVPVLLLSVVWIRMSLMLAFVPLMAYVVDAFGIYSASALTGVVVIRCLAGAFLPLMTTLLAERFGYGWGLTILATISLMFAVIPILVLRNGSHWRQYSNCLRKKRLRNIWQNTMSWA